jgi:murein L,D-transpeptidase YcbB/YkuD
LELMMSKWGNISGRSLSVLGVPVRGVPALAVLAVAGLVPASAHAARQPENILPASAPALNQAPTAAPAPIPAPTPAAAPAAVQAPLAPELVVEPVMHWPMADAQALLGVILKIGAEGLNPDDYQLDALRAAILGGEGAELDAQASRSFAWLAEDMRDGRTRMDSRLQWFAVDTDVDANPTDALMERALANHDVAGVIAGLAPTHPDYALLKARLAALPKANKAARDLVRINMDRWRWLQRDLGKFYLFTNVPEYQLRLTVDNTIIRSYKTIVGKPGKTATPQLAEVVEGVIFNPTWTVPQSIVVGEGLGARLVNNPKQAAREGYKVTKAADGTIIVVQQPGANNSLGRLKLDMPNEHAIFLHDTNARQLFKLPSRALSHGCVRTENAVQLGMTMARLGGGIPTAQTQDIANSGVYTKVPMTRTFPIYLTYFTYATDITGKLAVFKDIYDRDAAVQASFAAPRAPWDGKRKSSEAIIKLDNPL